MSTIIWLSSTMIVTKLKDTNIVVFLFQCKILDFKSHCYVLKYKAFSVMRKNVTLCHFSNCAFNMKIHALINK